MPTDDEYPTTSETRVVPSPGEEKARIEFALNQAESHTARMPPSPTTHRLKLALQGLRRIVDSWETRAPTGEELALLRRQVGETSQLARTNAPTVRLRRPA